MRSDVLAELRKRSSSAVRRAAPFQMAPYAFVRVELGRVRRQVFELEASPMGMDELTGLPGAVIRTAIGDQDHLPPRMVRKQLPEESDEDLGINLDETRCEDQLTSRRHGREQVQHRPLAIGAASDRRASPLSPRASGDMVGAHPTLVPKVEDRPCFSGLSADPWILRP